MARSWIACAVISALWFGATASWRPLAMPDEGRYVGVAFEMLRSGDWLVPTLDGLPFFHKPPLFYWITAAAMQLFGPGVAAARAAAWLASVAITTGLFAFVRRWVGAHQAWATVAVLGTLPLFYGAAQYANLDQLVAACVAATTLLVAHAALAREHGLAHRRALAAAFVAAALGVLAKGLIGIVLPVLVLLAWGLATRRAGRVLALWMWPPGWLLFIVIAAPWFVAMQHRFSGFAHYFFVVQHVQRFASAGFNNPQAWWFYPAALMLLTLPWSPWLLRALRRHRLAAASEPGDNADHTAVRLLAWVWVCVITLFFSLPSSKLVGYILPALPPLAILIAHAARRAPARARLFDASAVLAAGVCIGVTAYAHFYQPKSNQALAETLRALKQPGEPVLFLNGYYYDVNFYARLDAPAFVVDPWLPVEVAKDSWRRELVDAAGFAPAGSPQRLLQTDELAPWLCRTPSAWLITTTAAAPPPWLATLQPSHRSGETALWHIVSSQAATRAALHCAKTSSADNPG